MGETGEQNWMKKDNMIPHEAEKSLQIEDPLNNNAHK
jgi:hypothetical protein